MSRARYAALQNCYTLAVVLPGSAAYLCVDVVITSVRAFVYILWTCPHHRSMYMLLP